MKELMGSLRLKEKKEEEKEEGRGEMRKFLGRSSSSLGERVDGKLEIEGEKGGEEGRGKGRDEEVSGSKNEASKSS